MKNSLPILLILFCFTLSSFSQKVPGEKKANELLEKLTPELLLTENQKKQLKPAFVNYNAFVKLKKKEKKERKKTGKKLTKDQKKALKKEEDDKLRILQRKVAEVLTKEQYVKYLDFIEKMEKEKQ